MFRHFRIRHQFVLLETYICQDWRKKHFSYEIQKCFCFTIRNPKDLYSLFGSHISICAQIQIMFENQGLITDFKKISALINDVENNIAYWKECKQRKALAGKCDLFHAINC